MDKLEKGTIFSVTIDQKIEYWKIIGDLNKSFFSRGGSYPVVECDVNGNEFKRMRTFYQKYIKNHAVIISKG